MVFLFMKLSVKSIQDLKIALNKSFGENFCNELSDDELQEIGNTLLVVTAEHLKLKTCFS
jgi:hypothetical protein